MHTVALTRRATTICFHLDPRFKLPCPVVLPSRIVALMRVPVNGSTHMRVQQLGSSVPAQTVLS